MENTATESLVGQVVVFSFGGEEYALPIGRVQEIIRYTPPRSIASPIPWMQGVINLRGRIVPVCDPVLRYGRAAQQEASDTDTSRGDGQMIVIVETANGVSGIVVSGVSEVLTLTEDQVETSPTAAAGCYRGVAKVGDRLIALLDPDQVVGGIDQAA